MRPFIVAVKEPQEELWERRIFRDSCRGFASYGLNDCKLEYPRCNPFIHSGLGQVIDMGQEFDVSVTLCAVGSNAPLGARLALSHWTHLWLVS